jgi:hypothetical protein
MLGRLALVIHWAGFVSLVSFYGWIAFSFLTRSESALDLLQMLKEDYLYLAQLPPPSGRVDDAIWFWLANLYWPVRWITTGNRSPLPWVANKETNND